ncbi:MULTISPECIES: ATP-dependent RNA helicase HrpA [Eikenella]|uniref:RNA helicase n=1 Tax=Eikenella exigua TaxID=2528037 RepID=A0AAE6M555_9NEIS|nr:MULTISPECIES: ATP-dependent RNA helicase HrpA [Eikenella]OAM28300.1 ATP-dependent RNA helicase HrpA [Eikenella sp. NML01-A-086]OAM42075.1 ATP-dependent RNA helicase HrpA [Eikenella sp. NML97-A-109]QED92666.1 ATP-dependent RNA helicase HrpA [Eikenella exigua]
MPQQDFSQILSKDRHFLQSAFKNPNKYGGLSKVEEKYRKSHDLYLQRLSKLPKPEFDSTLPVHEKLEEIKKAIAENQVTIICGETGSGKTTQLPKICLELGRGAAGLIGHTQPRRLAARSVAERIAEELKSEIGSAVGYKVRFTDHTSRDACVKLMTDGILLAETQTDRYLSAYDTIIIDEAHERSLNIDFLLGYLKQLLPRRPDLKVIITSATIDAERFSQHFNGAPVLEVSGRTYPVEILYRPLTSKDEDDAEVELTDAIVDAADELARHGEGDILVFLPGEREIREAAEALRKSTLRRNDEILPLFARLSHAEQHKIFHPSGAKRRIVLATNVAETSLTVPGIKYVIDTGLARVKRYSARAKVEQLHVEKISQAAARQRSGRCGRVSAGVCIRLFSEEDFNSRTEFTDPEIVRSNLAAVILRMAALRLGDVAAFPFLEMPDSRYINDGFQVLLELGAVNEHNGLTKLGEQMARLPIDPKIARILLAAKKHDCMAEILVIASALSTQDPRERPLGARDAAAKAHERFTDKQSDFLAYLNIWDSFQRERDKGLSNKQLVQWCRQYFLSHLRMREWRELHHQLAQTAIEMGLTTKEAAFRRPPEVRQLTSSENAGDQDLSAKLKQKQLDKKQHRAQIRAAKEAGYEQIHRALLTGLIANVGMKSPDGNDYTGARGSRFHLFPASALFKAKPKWVMAAELVETTKLYARDVAAIQPEWIEQEAPHLVRYHYFEPHWEQKRGEVIASERVTLYGLTVLPRRPVSYGRIAPEEAREIFIRSALVAQECDLKADFFVHNKKLIKEITELEHKSRKQDVLVDDEALFAFYHERLPDMAWKDAQGSVWGSEDSVRIIESDKAERSSENEHCKFRQNENHGNTVGQVADSTPAETAQTIRFDNPTYAAQQTTPSPVGEGRGEGKTVAAQTNFSAISAIPLPQEREQSAAASTISDDPKAQRLPENSLCYADGQPILLGDRVTIDSKQWHGKIVALIAEQQCDPSIGSAEEWAALQSGVMAQFDEAGLVHYPDAETADELILLARADAADVLKSKKHNVGCVAQATHADSKDTNNRVREPSSHTLQNVSVSADPKPKKQPAPQKGRLKPLPLADIRTFQAWLKTAERDNPRLLFLSRDDLMQHAAAHITEEQFPKFWQTADGKFKLSYRFEPHHPLDGVTLTLPLTVLNRISPAALEWLVPGMIREKIQLQIKALPKQIRRICVPVPEFITQFLNQNPDRNAPILPQLAQAIAKTAGDIRILEQINQDERAAFRLPEHCYFNLRIIDDGGQELAMGRDLIQIQQQLGKAAATTFRDNTQEFERDNVTTWDIGTLPESIKFARGKQQLTGYLGLQKEKDGRIALRLFDTSAAAEQAHRLGVIELMKLQLKEQVKDLNKGIQGFTQAAMLLKHINADTLRDDLTQAVCDRAFIGEDELPRNEKAFKEQIKRARSRLPAVKEALSRYLQETAAAYAELNGKLGKHPLTHLLRQRLQTLLAAGFATRTPWVQWPRLPIYLKAMTLRLEKYSGNPDRDASREADIQELEQMWQEKTDGLVKQGQPVSDDLAMFKWMIEELRVSLFAQELKTPYPVSVKRLLKEWERLGN